MATNEPAEPKAVQPTKTEIVSGTKYEPGFRADKTAFPGVDPDTGERKAVTWAGLREEFGEREGARLYNALAIAAFGGVQPGRQSLSLITAIDEKYVRPRHRDPNTGQFTESEEDFQKARAKWVARREQVKKLIADAEAAKGA